ncbi:hypothetical protein FXO38_01716 [Capsicum annuum]|nr:hypothetical protein FXO38_01716 [Capsicum annuum]
MVFAIRSKQKGYYYRLDSDVDVLRFINSLKHKNFVDVYVVHQISEPIVVNDDVAATPPLLLLSNGDVAASFETDRADVSLSYLLDINEDEYINENHLPRADKGKSKVSLEDLGEGQVNDFSTYHLQTSDYELDFDITDSDGDSLYDAAENIEELSDFDEELLQGIDVGFEDICKNKGVRHEGKLGVDNPSFDSSDLGSDISDEVEGDPVNDDEVVDPLPRTSSSKIYFNKTTKKVCFQLYVVFVNGVEFREALQSYFIQKGVKRKLKPNEMERERAMCKHKSCPWVILGSVDNTGNFSVKTYFSVHKCYKMTRNKMCNPLWISKHYKDGIMSNPSIKLHQIQALLRKYYGSCIIHDLELQENWGKSLTVMSDMQKGIYLVLTNLLPNAEHRWCARHIWAKGKKVWSGEERKKNLEVARAPFEVYLQHKLNEMSELGFGIVEDLL